MSFVLLFLLLCGTQASLDFNNDSQQAVELSQLLRRMETMERTLHRQDRKLAHQETLLHTQHLQLARQETLLVYYKDMLLQQGQELAVLKAVNTDQDQQLSRQEDLLDQQRATLAHQDQLLRQQADTLAGQHSRLVHLQHVVSVLGKKSSLDHASVLHSDTKHLRDPTTEERKHWTDTTEERKHWTDTTEERKHWTDTTEERKHWTDTTEERKHWTDTTEERKHWTDIAHRGGSKDSGNLTSSSHDVTARSDDGGPLEAVVTQLSQQVTAMTADIQTLKNSNDQNDDLIRDARTSTFVRWGSSQCSGGPSQLVYHGIVGGSYYGHSGAAANFLCLTLSPRFQSQPLPYTEATVYGGEYETNDSHQNKDPVCAVCRTTYTTTIMIPGTNVCTDGWHEQYTGYLMAGASSHTAATEFICVDAAMESRDGSADNHNGKLLYRAKTVCGSLPCDPYVANNLVLCAVCSK